MLLALAMLVNSQGMTSMAAVIGGVTGGKKQTEAPQTETEPATEAAVQTEAPETEAPGEAEPESESEGLTPEEKEAMSEAAAETELPAETELVTEAPEAVTETVTEAQTEIETELESESESEDLTAAEIVEDETGVYTYEDDAHTMIVTATLTDPSAVPAGAVFVVEKKELTDEEKALVEEQLSEGVSSYTYTAYDMHFEYNGEEIELAEGSVEVSVQYTQTVQ